MEGWESRRHLAVYTPVGDAVLSSFRVPLHTPFLCAGSSRPFSAGVDLAWIWHLRDGLTGAVAARFLFRLGCSLFRPHTMLVMPFVLEPFITELFAG